MTLDQYNILDIMKCVNWKDAVSLLSINRKYRLLYSREEHNIRQQSLRTKEYFESYFPTNNVLYEYKQYLPNGDLEGLRLLLDSNNKCQMW
jgi:hypothetical protein